MKQRFNANSAGKVVGRCFRGRLRTTSFDFNTRLLFLDDAVLGAQNCGPGEHNDTNGFH
jgi:hypothetical protein